MKMISSDADLFVNAVPSRWVTAVIAAFNGPLPLLPHVQNNNSRFPGRSLRAKKKNIYMMCHDMWGNRNENSQQVNESQCVFYLLSPSLNCNPPVGACVLQLGPGIACSGLWTSASTIWRSPTPSSLMTPCTSVRPRRPPSAPEGPSWMCSVSELQLQESFYWFSLSVKPLLHVLFFAFNLSCIRWNNATLIVFSMWRVCFMKIECQTYGSWAKIGPQESPMWPVPWIC